MDEEIDDERKDRISRYGTPDSGCTYNSRRLRTELGTRLGSYAEAEAMIEVRHEGHPPFFREKPQTLAITDGEPAHLSCFAVGDPKPAVQWFKNDNIVQESKRIKILADSDGRSILQFQPATIFDIGIYKAVARNKISQTVSRARVVHASEPDPPEAPEAVAISDTEVLLRWKQPRHDGNLPVLCYSLEYKTAVEDTYLGLADNIDHEFFVVHGLQEQQDYHFVLSARNRIGWSDMGTPSRTVTTLAPGAPKIQVTRAMKHLQQLTESGHPISIEEIKPTIDYRFERNPVDWQQETSYTDNYNFISEINRGRFSIVVKGVEKTTDHIVVAKILELNTDTARQVQREFEIFRTLRHERIAQLVAAFKPQNAPIAVLIQEKLQGADVLTYLSSRHEYNEQTVATIITQVSVEDHTGRAQDN
jgi:hypothetical protein